eukprot:1146614-Pelagomonas_calceolata.AAC.4
MCSTAHVDFNALCNSHPWKGKHLKLNIPGLLCLDACSPFQAARYHSLVIKRDTIPEDLEITAWTEDGTIMAARHKQYPNLQVCRPVQGIVGQF